MKEIIKQWKKRNYSFVYVQLLKKNFDYTLDNFEKYFSKISNVDEINFNSFAVNGVTRLLRTIPFVIPPANQMTEIAVKVKTFRRTSSEIDNVNKINNVL